MPLPDDLDLYFLDSWASILVYCIICRLSLCQCLLSFWALCIVRHGRSTVRPMMGSPSGILYGGLAEWLQNIEVDDGGDGRVSNAGFTVLTIV